MVAFAPLLGRQANTLILGSMPGQKSLELREYYAHPRNAFWPIMQALYGVDSSLDYSSRIKALAECSVSVWDVLYNCDRKGSLDSNIVSGSIEANDFSTFFMQHPSIRIVGFNGQAARKLFDRHCRSVYDQFSSIVWVDLPSSSPAYAAMTFEKKRQIWKHNLRRPK